MTESSSEDRPLSAAQIAVADGWADFAKALAIYPEKHDRVCGTAARFFEAFADVMRDPARQEGEGIDVIFYEAGVLICGHRAEPAPGGNRDWLGERIYASSLAGVEFLAELSPAVLSAFTKRLLELHRRADKDQRFEDLWPEAYLGLRLIPRQFEGAFSGDETDAEVIQRSWGGRGALRLDLEQEESLAALLAGSDGIRDRVHQLEGLLASRHDAAAAPSRRMDLVGRIVKLMPADALRSFQKVVDLTMRMLDGLLERLGSRGQLADASPFEGVLLERLMFITSRIAFGRQGPSARDLAAKLAESGGAAAAAAPDQPAPRRHASDDAITDDPHEFFAELKKLGASPRGTDLLADVELPAEQLGVYLHYLVHTKDPRIGSSLGAVLARLLRAPGPGELEVLAQYLQWRRGAAASANGADPERLVDFLRSAHLTHLRRECDLVSIGTIREQFPRDFALYLELMDFANQADVAELEALCSALGPKRLRDAGDELETLAEDTVKALLSGSVRTWMPLAWVILERTGERYRTVVVDYLRRLKLDSPEACLLTITQDPYSLAVDYLQALLLPPADEQGRSRLKHQISSVICAFVRSTAGQPEFESKRAYAVKFLAKFATHEARRLLRQLLADSSLVFIKNEPKSVRRAAREVLKRLTEADKGGARV